MKVSELTDRADLELLNEIHDREIVSVFISDMVSDIIAGMSPGDILVTRQTHKLLIETANMGDASAVIFVRGKKPDAGVIGYSNKCRLTLLSTSLDAWNLALKLSDAGLR